MKFVRKNINTNKYIDNVFSVSTLAKKDPNGINATAGCLAREDGKLLAYNSVFNNEKNISPINNAAYANPAGNKDYLDKVAKHVLEDKVTNNYRIISSAGGTGAIFLAIKSCLGENDTIIFPEVGWGNYKVMAQEFNLNVLNYDIYNLDSLLNKIDEVEGKVFVVINSPSHNPCGHAYTLEEWKKIIDKLNSLNKEVVLLNDIAYIDYSFENCKEYFKLFNNISDNMLVILAYSCSKSFSYYGKRVGAFIAINNDNDFLDTYINLCTRLARSAWSNVNNGAMQNIASVLTDHLDEYMSERKEAIELLEKRSKLFMKQADECGLDYYPYNSGFFVTLKFDDLKKRDEVHQKLIDKHIYTVKVNKGIRIGICALSLSAIDGLALKIKEAM